MAMGPREARLAHFLMMAGGIILTIVAIAILIAGFLSIGDLLNE